MPEENIVEQSEVEAKNLSPASGGPMPNQPEVLKRGAVPVGGNAGSNYCVGVAICFSLLAIVLGWYGLWRMNEYRTTDMIVGGDAYNYIIWAMRGVGWICAGVVSGLIAVVFAVFSLRLKREA